MSSHEERRAAPRTPQRLNVRYRIKGDRETHLGILKNISAVGVFVSTSKPLARGTEIEIMFDRDGFTVEMEAVVARKVWVPPDLRLLGSPGFGARLLSTDEVVVKARGDGAEEEVAAAPSRDDAGVFHVRLGERPEARRRQLEDLRYGGVFVATENPPALNEKVRLLVIVGDEAIACSGTVVQRVAGGQAGDSSPGMGVHIAEAEAVAARLQALAGESSAPTPDPD